MLKEVETNISYILHLLSSVSDVRSEEQPLHLRHHNPLHVRVLLNWQQ